MRSLVIAILSAIVVLFIACSEKKPETAQPEKPVQQPLQAADSSGIRPVNFVWGNQQHRMINFFFQPTDSLRMFAPDLLKKASGNLQVRLRSLAVVCAGTGGVLLFCEHGNDGDVHLARRAIRARQSHLLRLRSAIWSALCGVCHVQASGWSVRIRVYT